MTMASRLSRLSNRVISVHSDSNRAISQKAPLIGCFFIGHQQEAQGSPQFYQASPSAQFVWEGFDGDLFGSGYAGLGNHLQFFTGMDFH